MKSGTSFSGVRVAVIPLPALGDLTVYVHLAWRFACAGADVRFYSASLYPARQYFPWLTIVPEQDAGLVEVSADVDLVLACFEKCYMHAQWTTAESSLDNVALVTAKKISKVSGLDGRPVKIRDVSYDFASRAFCLDTQAGLTMVDWVDEYVDSVYGLKRESRPELAIEANSSRSNLVLIFPTTPELKKNYWMTGFRLLAAALERKGWEVAFVCTPKERDSVASQVSAFKVESCDDLGALMDLVGRAGMVISNDSGGGHLASLMGLPTFTITRRRDDFVWRPGFNERNMVLRPAVRFKLFGKYVWRPFVPVWRIATAIGTPPSQGNEA